MLEHGSEIQAIVGGHEKFHIGRGCSEAVVDRQGVGTVILKPEDYPCRSLAPLPRNNGCYQFS